MSLWTFFLSSLLAVAFLGWLAMRLYGLPRPAIPDEKTARERYLADFFEDRVEAVLLDASRRHALLLLADPSAVGLVMALGDGLVTRRLDRTLLKAVETGGERWRLLLDDLVLPRIEPILCPEDATSPRATELRERLEKIAGRA